MAVLTLVVCLKELDSTFDWNTVLYETHFYVNVILVRYNPVQYQFDT